MNAAIWGQRLKRAVLTLAPIVFLALAAWVLWRAFASLKPAEVLAAARAWGPGRLVLSALLGLACFGAVGLVEWRALRWAKAPAPFGFVMLVSFIANGFAHMIGASALVSGLIRGRLYARIGGDLVLAGAATAYQTASFAVSLALMMGVALIVQGGPMIWRAGGWAMVAGVALYLAACAVLRRPVKIGARSYELPGLVDGLIQVALGVADNALAIACLWVLLPPPTVGYPAFTQAYVLSYLGGLVSGVPGGAGTFEGVMVRLLPDLDRAGLAAAFIGFRLVFYLLPLVLAAVLLALDTLANRLAPEPPPKA